MLCGPLKVCFLWEHFVNEHMVYKVPFCCTKRWRNVDMIDEISLIVRAGNFFRRWAQTSWISQTAPWCDPSGHWELDLQVFTHLSNCQFHIKLSNILCRRYSIVCNNVPMMIKLSKTLEFTTWFLVHFPAFPFGSLHCLAAWPFHQLVKLHAWGICCLSSEFPARYRDYLFLEHTEHTSTLLRV